MKKINWNEVALTVWTIVGAMLVVMMILFAGGCFKQASEPVEQEPIIKYVEVQKEQMFDTRHTSCSCGLLTTTHLTTLLMT